MRILHATSELFPFSKTGGLADMTAALAKAVAKAGHRVGVVTPLYRGIAENPKTDPPLRRFDWQLDLPLGDGHVSGEVWVQEPRPDLTIYFVRHDGFYHRPGIYNEHGRDYEDNAARFLFLSKAAVHLARYLPWQPEIVHVHDWQTALVPLLIKHLRERDGWWNAPRTCLTIHNLAYQGLFAADRYALANLPRDYFHTEGCEYHGAFNCLKAGIAFAERITTVSPRYAREITTEAFGWGLDGLLRRRGSCLSGILNGVDYEEWSPGNDPHLPQGYTPADLSGKAACKATLLRELGLPARLDHPLFGSIGRLTDQKGPDLLLGALEEMLAADLQFVVLGSGDAALESAYRRLEARFPEKVAVELQFNNALSHRIEAGCDFFLMPSRFEPSGLNQMYSQRYGTVPIVRRTGGLDDSVVDLGDDPELATGIKFNEPSARALAKAIRKAIVLYRHPELFRATQIRGMETDFSWERTAEDYLRFYDDLLAARL